MKKHHEVPPDHSEATPGHIRFRGQPPVFQKFYCDALASSMGTICSAPFNFVRNMKYSTNAAKVTPTTWNVLSQLRREAARQPTWWKTFMHIQQRFVIGWGLVQIGPRIAFTQLVFDYLQVRFGNKA